ncbi:MAG: patatin-like phospholipase family protein [Clostridia bacterium]|nr:patatin-like phospholipase family protein [Clostridia bacterium]
MNLGLVLSGGGVKGAAHIGVLKALQEENIKFNYLAGTSSGSIVASLYACGYNSDEIYDLFKKYCKEINYIDFKNLLKIFWNLILKRKLLVEGLNSGKKLEKIIKKACEEKNIENINQIDFNLIVPAVDLYNGSIYYFCSKKNKFNNRQILDDEKYIYDVELAKAVKSSCSYPGIFSPTKFKNTLLIDGGVRDNTPWKKLKEYGADKTLSICFETTSSAEKIKTNLMDNVIRSIEIEMHELTAYELEGADCILKIKTEKISLLDSSKIDYLYNLGYQETKRKIKEIKNTLNID